MRIQAILTVVSLAVFAMSSVGCARMKEGARGALGISTKVLEQERPNALRQSVAIPYTKSMEKGIEALNKMGCYIYAQKPWEGMVAVYVSDSDSTPVGIFFSKIDEGTTKVEVSSQSTYAREFVSQKLFSMLAEPAAAPEVKKDEPAK